MNENLKECKIIGYGTFTDKDSQEKMLRILIGIKSERENYNGIMIAPPVFLNYNTELDNKLKKAIHENNLKTYYKTSDDIITGKTKVTEIIFE